MQKKIRKYYWPLIQVIQTLSYIPRVISRVDNWYAYYIDMIFKNNKHRTWEMRVGGVTIALRRNSVDRWSALENLVLEKLDVRGLEGMVFDTIIDLGANIGASVLFFSKTYPKARIYAIEPLVENIELLKENIRINNISDRVEIIQTAVSSSKSPNVELYLNRNNAESSLVRVLRNVKRPVNNMNFHEIKNLIKGSTLLKMDIEGAEYEILDKAYLSFIKSFKVIMLEGHPFVVDNGKDLIIRFLRMNGIKFSVKERFFVIIP